MFDLIRRGLGAAPSSIDGNYVIVTTGEEVLDSAPRHRGTTPKGSPRGVRRPVGPLAFRGRTPRLRLALARWARCARHWWRAYGALGPPPGGVLTRPGNTRN